MKKATIVILISFLYIGLFLYSGVSKLIDHALFREQMAVSPVIAPLAPYLAWALPLIEIFLAAMLFIPKCRLKALYACLALMIAFTIYLIAINALGGNISCGCGGELEQLTWLQHIGLNGLFIVLAAIGIFSLNRMAKENSMKWLHTI